MTLGVLCFVALFAVACWRESRAYQDGVRHGMGKGRRVW